MNFDCATLPVDIADLPLELRMHLLGLPLKPVGRPRALTFRQRLTIAIRWREVHDSRARRRSTQDPRTQPILRRIGRLRAQNAAPWKIDRLSRQLSALGRYGAILLEPPVERKPEIDGLVAKETGGADDPQ